jgi:ketosteroid isomerase-like protein
MAADPLATEFIAALDANDADWMAKLIDPRGSWWVDSGLDRSCGVRGYDPGTNRAWPVHGTMNLGEKVELLRGIRTRFPAGVRQIEWNSFGIGQYTLIEVDGDGVTSGGRHYRNRYAFVIEISGGKVLHVREYLDTHHAVNTFEGRNVDRRGVAPDLENDVIEQIGQGTDVALAFAAAIDRADTEAMRAISTPDSVWWGDAGHDRARGDRSAPIESDPRKFLVGNAHVHDRAAVLPQLRSSFSDGWSLRPWRVFGEGSSVALEAESHGIRVRKDGTTKSYQNRYCFVLELSGDKVARVREYCDTLHAFDVFGIAP